MIYKGYAFKENEKEQLREIRERYREIRHLRDQIDWNIESRYAHNIFEGTWDKSSKYDAELRNLSDMDFLILADSGNLCFGGKCYVDRKKRTLRGRYNTD